MQAGEQTASFSSALGLQTYHVCALRRGAERHRSERRGAERWRTARRGKGLCTWEMVQVEVTLKFEVYRASYSADMTAGMGHHAGL